MTAWFENMRFSQKVVLLKLCVGTLGMMIAIIYTFVLQPKIIDKTLNVLKNHVSDISQKEADYYATNSHFVLFGRQKQESIDGLAALGFDPRPFMKGNFEYQVTATSKNSIRVDARIKDSMIAAGSMPLLLFQKTLTTQSAMQVSQQ